MTSGKKQARPQPKECGLQIRETDMASRPVRDGKQAPIADSLLPRDTSRSFPIALLRARESIMSRFRPMLAKHGFTEQQWRVLRMVGEVDSIEASELAERTCILAPSLTRILQNLEARGLLRRATSKADARRRVIQATGRQTPRENPWPGAEAGAPSWPAKENPRPRYPAHALGLPA